MAQHSLPEYPFYDGAPTPIPIAHRGGDAAGPEKENSIAAFDSAWQAGIRYGETDTVATADGVALAIHGSANPKHEARTGLPVRDRLQEMTLGEVKDEVRIGGEEIPTLEELLTTFPGMRFFIDPKTTESVEPLAKLIKKLGVHDRVSIGAMNYERTEAAAELAGGPRKVCTSLGVMGSLSLLGSGIRFPGATSYLRRTNAAQLALPHKLSHFHVPPSDEGTKSHITLTTAKMVERAHELGLRVMLWTPNTEAALARAFDTGADGVMSDRTRLVKEMADSRQDPVQ